MDHSIHTAAKFGLRFQEKPRLFDPAYRFEMEKQSNPNCTLSSIFHYSVTLTAKGGGHFNITDWKTFAEAFGLPKKYTKLPNEILEYIVLDVFYHSHSFTVAIRRSRLQLLFYKTEIGDEILKKWIPSYRLSSAFASDKKAERIKAFEKFNVLLNDVRTAIEGLCLKTFEEELFWACCKDYDEMQQPFREAAKNYHLESNKGDSLSHPSI